MESLSLTVESLACVCSKPLQVLNAMSTCRALKVRQSHLIIISGTIGNHELFVRFVRDHMHDEWTTIHVVPSHHDAPAVLKQLKYDMLAVESDQVSDYHRYLPLARNGLIVIEEGLGTYIGGFSSQASWSRRVKWRAISAVTGCGLEYGAGRKTAAVACVLPEAMVQLKPWLAGRIIAVDGPLTVIERYWPNWELELATYLAPEAENGEVVLLLYTWGTFESVNEHLSSVAASRAIVYIKSHPRDHQPATGKALPQSARSIPGWIPAEAVICALSQRHEHVHVHHYGSSAPIYASLPNITFRNSAPTGALEQLFALVKTEK